MNTFFSDEQFNHFFASLPWIAAIVILIVTYLTVRRSLGKTAPIGQTFACATCGRRGVREHMVPQQRDGAVLWSCTKCAGSH
jgi:hypothetical protein